MPSLARLVQLLYNDYNQRTNKNVGKTVFQIMPSSLPLFAPSANSPPAFTFVTHTGPPSKSLGTQRLVRSHVMRRVGKSRQKGRPVKAPLLEFDLEVPDEPFWDEASLQPSQNYFLNQSTVEWIGDAVDQESDDRQSTSNLEASDAQSHHRVKPQQKVIQYSQNASQVQNTERSENEHRQNEEITARIERLWVGRSDPFARYPIKMNSRAHELIAHSQYPKESSSYFIVISTPANKSFSAQYLMAGTPVSNPLEMPGFLWA
jgi:hypothetical protein